MTSPGAPTVSTLDPVVSGATATFKGEGLGFPASDNLEVYYKYGKGAILPISPLETPHVSVAALSGSTPIPGFPITETCVTYSYQVCYTLVLI